MKYSTVGSTIVVLWCVSEFFWFPSKLRETQGLHTLSTGKTGIYLLLEVAEAEVSLYYLLEKVGSYCLMDEVCLNYLEDKAGFYYPLEETDFC